MGEARGKGGAKKWGEKRKKEKDKGKEKKNDKE